MAQWFGSATEGAQRLSRQLSQLSQQVQENATVPCSVCSQRYLRANTFWCQECGKPFCRNCKLDEGLMPFLEFAVQTGQTEQVVACSACGATIVERGRALNVEARTKRATDFLQGTLEPFTYSPERKLEKALRLGGHAFYGLKQVGSFIPLWKTATAVKAGYYLVRYGPLMFAGNEILEAFQLLTGLARKIDGASGRLMSSDLFGGLYYMMGELTAERGQTPELEEAEHMDERTGGIPAPDQDLLRRLQKPMHLLYIAKEPTPTDAQRLLQQALPGADLMLAELSETPTVPSHFLVGHKTEMKVYLILPGTRNPADLVTDFNVQEVPLGGGQAHRGMALAAQWLMAEVAPVLLRLHVEGYDVVIIGHSLGAGVGGLLTVLLRPQIPSLSCYGFGTPACADEALLPQLFDCMVTVVNHDDMVPRLSVLSVQKLLDSTLCPGQVEKTKRWMAEDWRAVKDVERVVELRRRGSAPRSGSEGPRVSSAGAANEDTGIEESKIALLVEAGVDRDVAVRALKREDGDVSRALLAATEEEVSSPQVSHDPTDSEPTAADGGEGSPTVAVSSSADFFHRAVAAASGTAGAVLQQTQPLLRRLSTSDAGLVAATSGINLGPSASSSSSSCPDGRHDPNCAAQQHVRFFIPGRIIHLYRQNGLGRAAFAAYSHDTFSRITLSRDMLEDHKLTAYDEALRQALLSNPKAPKWEAFGQRQLCACCGSDFSWAYILRSEPQRMLARHQCYACGAVVCDGCSQRRLSHPHLGFAAPVRTCDGCFFRKADVAD